ncbi:hypothetical protein DFJ74DRAFT_684151 [Hyaloraphidium curvatum]|nr:hypothetical protein DFJ74DRAFT_684151 [Hyaloraphidium curvatum]
MHIYTSPLPDVVLPDVEDVPDFILNNGALDLAQPALADGITGETWTFGELRDKVDGLARAMVGELGVKAGDIVCYLSSNHLAVPLLVYGAMRCSAAVSGISTLATPDEVAFQLTDTGARLLFVHDSYMEKARAAVALVGIDIRIIPLGTISQLVSLGASLPLLPPLDRSKDLGSRICSVFYSSGTTGRSKGVLQSHRNVIAAALAVRAMEEGLMIPGRDRMLLQLPIYHIFGQNKVMHTSLSAGITLVLLPSYDLKTFLAAITRFKITRLAVVPPQAIQLVKESAVLETDCSTIRYITCGGAVMGPEVHRALKERFGVLVKNGYGQTETTSSICVTPADGGYVLGSVGKLIPSFRAYLRDPETGQPVAPGQQGEILIKGPQVMSGYLNRPDAAADAFVDGWLATGDVGFVDKDDNWYIVDRLKELIKTNGLQVAPAEVEDQVLRSGPEIVECAVVPRPHPTAGEVPVAYVVLRDPNDRSVLVRAEEHLRQHIASYKVPRTWRVVDALEKTASGKIRRKAMADMERARWEREEGQAGKAKL